MLEVKGGTAMLTFILAASLLAAGCACEHGIGLTGDQDADQDASDETIQGSWDPPIENLGEPGWGESTEPWCPGITPHRMAFSLWSRPGAVFANVVDNEGDCAHDVVNHLFVNRGRGWSVFYEESLLAPGAFMFANIRGTTDDRIFAWMNSNYPLATIADVGLQMSDFKPSSVFVMNDTLAWACTDVGLLTWDGDDWSRVLHEPCTGQIWADESSLFATAEDGLINELGDGGWIVHDTGLWSGVGIIWGFSRTDLWASSGLALLHYDGVDWEMIDWPSMDVGAPNAIRQLWGNDGVLFMNTGQQLLRLEDGVFETIGVWPGTDSGDTTFSIVQMWGNSPTELFLAVEDFEYTRPGCGDYFLLWWDGHDFHWF